MAIKVLLADDHAIVRHGLSKSIQGEKDMEVVGQARDGHNTIDLARELRPDVILMDVAMPDLNGIEATRQIVKELPKISVVGLSMHSSKRFVTEMFRAGAAGYVLKDSPFKELAEAIRAVADGKQYLSPSITGVVLDSYVRSSPEEKSSAFGMLTQREREVLQLLAEGNTTKQIARRLYLSPKTIESHRLRIMNKLDIDSVAELTKYAIQEGLTSPEL